MNEYTIWGDMDVKKLSEEISNLGIYCSKYMCKQLLKKLNLRLRKMSKNITLKSVKNK